MERIIKKAQTAVGKCRIVKNEMEIIRSKLVADFCLLRRQSRKRNKGKKD
jgi:hypothetical protein